MDFSQKVIELSHRLEQAAKEQLAGCTLTVTEHGALDPKFLAFLLLCRTITNYAAVIVLTERRLVVEARALARCCCENLFLVGGLQEQGRAFADLMKEDDDAGRQQRLKFARSTDEIFGSLEPDMQQQVIRALEKAGKAKFLSPKGASHVGVFKNAYLAHSQFSGDAAHATLTALSRYWKRSDGTMEIDAHPAAEQGELDQTLLFASMAVLGLLGSIDEMFGGVPIGESLPALRGELQALQDDKGDVARRS